MLYVNDSSNARAHAQKYDAQSNLNYGKMRAHTHANLSIAHTGVMNKLISKMRAHTRDATLVKLQAQFVLCKCAVKMGNKTSCVVVEDCLTPSKFTTEYFLPSVDYPVCKFLKDNGDQGDVLDATKVPAVKESAYLVTHLLFNRHLVSYTSCLLVESRFIFFLISQGIALHITFLFG